MRECHRSQSYQNVDLNLQQHPEHLQIISVLKVCCWLQRYKDVDLFFQQYPKICVSSGKVVTMLMCFQQRPKICVGSGKVVSMLMCFQQRPEFREIIPILEECRQSQAVAMLSNVDPPPSLFPSALPMVTQQETDSEGRNTPPLVGHVSALRNHWEMEASRNRWEEGRGDYTCVLMG